MTVNMLHPAGFMDTIMVKETGSPPRSTVAEGATAVMNLAASRKLEGRIGLYFDELKEARADDQAYDRNMREQLEKLSRKLTGL